MPHSISDPDIPTLGRHDHGEWKASRNIFGRAGKLFMAPLIGGADGTSVVSNWQWLANVTSITASFEILKEEVKMSGAYSVHYRPAGFMGNGTLTIDKINSDFEDDLIRHVAAAKAGCTPTDPQVYQIRMSLEDKDNPDIVFDDHGFAVSGHEEILLSNVQIWNLPVGYDTTSMVTRDIDFTFSCPSFMTDGSNNPRKISDPVIPFDRIVFC